MTVLTRPGRSIRRSSCFASRSDGSVRPDRTLRTAAPCGARIHGYGCDLLLRYGAQRSSGDLVLVGEAAGDLLCAGWVPGAAGLRWPGVSLSRRRLAQGSVRPGCVVVDQVFGQYPPQARLVDDQELAGEFPAQGADDRFADGVCPGRLRRAGESPGARCGDGGAGGIRELASAIPDQERDVCRGCAGVPVGEVPRLAAAEACWYGGSAAIPSLRCSRSEQQHQRAVPPITSSDSCPAVASAS